MLGLPTEPIVVKDLILADALNIRIDAIVAYREFCHVKATHQRTEFVRWLRSTRELLPIDKAIETRMPGIYA